MVISIAYPVPFQSDENWAEFKPFVERFCRTWREFPPGVDCTVYAIALDRELGNGVKRMFDGLPVKFPEVYTGGGFDIGAAQFLSELNTADFQISVPTRVYFHREGWGRRFLEARARHGRGLYGTSASWEGGSFHFRTACYGMDTDDWHIYPHTIDSREKGTFFEIGQDNPIGSLWEWFTDRNQTAYVVYWDSEHSCTKCMMDPDNIFRRGDQSNLLAWDKHTDYWRDAPEEERMELSRLAFTKPQE